MYHHQARRLGATRPCLVLALVLLPLGGASAAPDDLPVATANLGSDMRIAPPGATHVTAAPSPLSSAGQIIYLNYEGGTINSGGGYDSDAPSNSSWVCQGTFSPFGAGAMQDASIQATRADWEAYGVSIVTSRPASGNYTMNMVGNASCGPNNSGVAPVDCENENPNDIVFSFVNSGIRNADIVATINSQEIAHSFGLMHVNMTADIMNPFAGSDNVAFLDECFSITGSVSCGPQHAAQCGSETQQNSHMELLTLFGSSIPDTGPPTVSITAPNDGDVFTAPADLTVTADASDDQGLQELRINLDGVDQNSADTSAPFSWPVTGLPVGTYTFEVLAIDVAANSTMSGPVTIVVEEEGSGGGSGGSDPTDGGTDGGTAGGGGSAGGGGGSAGGGGSGGMSTSGGGATSGWDPGPTDGGSLPPGFGGSGESDGGGCGCRQEDTGPPPTLAFLMLIGIARRRRITAA